MCDCIDKLNAQLKEGGHNMVLSQSFGIHGTIPNAKVLIMAKIPQISDRDIAAVKHALAMHQGEGNRITVEDLTKRVYGEFTTTLRRRLREVVQKINTLPGERMVLTDTTEGGFWFDDDDIMPAARNIVSEEGRKDSLDKKISAMKNKAIKQWGKAKFDQAIQQAQEESQPLATTFQRSLLETD